MKVLVCGGRDYKNLHRVYRILGRLAPEEIVEGGANGADKLSRLWAGHSEVICHTYPARWRAEGKAAGPKRNGRMLVAHPDIRLVIAFPGGDGTADMIRQAHGQKIPVIEVPDVGKIHRFECDVVQFWNDTYPRCTCDGWFAE